MNPEEMKKIVEKFTKYELTPIQRLKQEQKEINRVIGFWEDKKRVAEYHINKNNDKYFILNKKIADLETKTP